MIKSIKFHISSFCVTMSHFFLLNYCGVIIKVHTVCTFLKMCTIIFKLYVIKVCMYYKIAHTFKTNPSNFWEYMNIILIKMIKQARELELIWEKSFLKNRYYRLVCCEISNILWSNSLSFTITLLLQYAIMLRFCSSITLSLFFIRSIYFYYCFNSHFYLINAMFIDFLEFRLHHKSWNRSARTIILLEILNWNHEIKRKRVRQWFENDSSGF